MPINKNEIKSPFVQHLLDNPVITPDNVRAFLSSHGFSGSSALEEEPEPTPAPVSRRKTRFPVNGPRVSAP